MDFEHLALMQKICDIGIEKGYIPVMEYSTLNVNRSTKERRVDVAWLHMNGTPVIAFEIERTTQKSKNIDSLSFFDFGIEFIFRPNKTKTRYGFGSLIDKKDNILHFMDIIYDNFVIEDFKDRKNPILKRQNKAAKYRYERQKRSILHKIFKNNRIQRETNFIEEAKRIEQYEIDKNKERRRYMKVNWKT